ncbi:MULTISPECIES: hypothetical protein [Pseudomonas]|uniref:hypothetical protein n=1 Tax=Pseudomonas TaxID=286 RepID=UPI00046CB075|nr:MULTISPECIES: hypothetical protein [Pseudomonas]QVE16817.1 hypothetical protein KGD89_23790 [Pseudomonas cichorii]
MADRKGADKTAPFFMGDRFVLYKTVQWNLNNSAVHRHRNADGHSTVLLSGIYRDAAPAEQPAVLKRALVEIERSMMEKFSSCFSMVQSKILRFQSIDKKLVW